MMYTLVEEVESMPWPWAPDKRSSFALFPFLLVQHCLSGKVKIHLNAKCISSAKQYFLIERKQVKGQAKIQGISHISVNRFVTLSGPTYKNVF